MSLLKNAKAAMGGVEKHLIEVGVGVPPDAVPLVYAGAQMPGKLLPENPELVTIDWQAALAAYPQAPGL